MESVEAFTRGRWHEEDKDRIIAHLVQPSLALQDAIVGSSGDSDEEITRLLPSGELNNLETRLNRFDHLSNVVELYFLTMHCRDLLFIAKPRSEETVGFLAIESDG